MKKKSHIEMVVVPIDQVESPIYIIRGQSVMLDADLAALFGVETKDFKAAVERNAMRFPEAFMFQLSPEDRNNLRSQFVTSNLSLKMDLPRQSYAFTEHGVTVMSAILDSERAGLPPEPPKRRIGFGAGDEDGIEG